jgi:hypothetical protein
VSSTVPPTDPNAVPPAEKAKQFPTTPGVFLMKDAQGRVVYIGEAKNLRSRASHYLIRAAACDLPLQKLGSCRRLSSGCLAPGRRPGRPWAAAAE